MPRFIYEKKPSAKVGGITQIRLPEQVSKACQREAIQARMHKSQYLAQIVMRRHTAAVLETSIAKRVEDYCKRTGKSKNEAVNALLRVALGYVE